MTTYRVTLVIETPYNPAKWDWDELVASEENENVLEVRIEKTIDSSGVTA